MKTLKAILIVALLYGVSGAVLAQTVWQHLMFAVKPCAVCNANIYQQQLTQMGSNWHVIVPNGYSSVGGTPVYAATWDGVSSCVNVTVGNINMLNMQFMGWPMVAC